ncbi:unnamed protein product [Paramecium primaurelia]|uniref:EF-hand domain-containing protein n=2 Tax=Paramecium TaxID=5884 RepID=A0A8S1TCI3_9CILI|nr:unnamed protein product [Paramecium primaurelia]CAD8151911.1 unnamed protein product [Paramecium pentaurelia]
MITPQEQLDIIIKKITKSLLGKSQTTIRTLGKTFRGFESFDKNNRMDKDEFLIGLKQNGVVLTKFQTDFLLNYLDRNRDGSIDVAEFFYLIRGTPNENRMQVIIQAFKKFDKDNLGYIVADDFKGIFNAKNHPKVTRGELTEDQAYIELLQYFKEGNKSGHITLDEWKEYYAAISADIEKDDNFILLIKETWRLK